MTMIGCELLYCKALVLGFGRPGVITATQHSETYWPDKTSHVLFF